jgi:hypothetical protein
VGRHPRLPGRAEVSRLSGLEVEVATFEAWDPDAYLTGCGKAADGMRQAGTFGEPEQWRFDWERRYTRDERLELVPTFGGHSQIRPAKRAELLAGIGAAVHAAGGSFTAQYATLAVTAARAGDSASA